MGPALSYMCGVTDDNEKIDINSSANGELSTVGHGVKRLCYTTLSSPVQTSTIQRTTAHHRILYPAHRQKNVCSVLFWYHGMINGCSFAVHRARADSLFVSLQIDVAPDWVYPFGFSCATERLVSQREGTKGQGKVRKVWIEQRRSKGSTLILTRRVS